MRRRVFTATLVLALALFGGSNVGASCWLGLCAMAPDEASAAQAAETSMEGHCDAHRGPGYRPAPGGEKAFEDCCASLIEVQELPAAPSKKPAPFVTADASADEVDRTTPPSTDSLATAVLARPGRPPNLFTLNAAFLI